MLSWGEKWGLVRRWVEHGPNREVPFRKGEISLSTPQEDKCSLFVTTVRELVGGCSYLETY